MPASKSAGYEPTKADKRRALVQSPHVLLGLLREHGVAKIPEWLPTEYGYPILHLYRLIDHHFDSDMQFPNGGSEYLRTCLKRDGFIDVSDDEVKLQLLLQLAAQNDFRNRGSAFRPFSQDPFL